MWTRVGGISHRQRDIFIVVCYFSLTSSPYTIHCVEDGNPFGNLFKSISKFGAMGDIIILGDFNAQTKDPQTLQYDYGSDLIYSTERDPTSMGLQRLSEDHSRPLNMLWSPPSPIL